MAEKWYLRTQDDTFGPETRDRMLEWARMGPSGVKKLFRLKK